ncbi:efflux RND transporter periplasmic adaptor subunit [Nostoc sp. C052]|uniref:efflux RND transporter periplasmic adaptor subunit n=1 Tax=Nostoc sp. C052 TaxID=2576902 RepID=UPI0021172CAB|nr:efflux RND transporter periplasmic adaptor subunit [Nostoc sp. C052]
MTELNILCHSIAHLFESVSSEPTADLKNSAANRSSSVLAPVSTDRISTDETASKPPPQRKRWLWVILAVLLIGGGGFVGWRLLGNRKAVPPKAPPLSVKVQTVESSQVQSTSEFVGTLEAQERVSLQPQVQGRIERIFVASGDRVSKGTPILSLSLDQTQANVSSAIAVVNSNRAAVVTAQAQLEQQQANQVKAAADVKLQQVQFQRSKMLVTEGAQARQELDIAKNNIDAAIATLNAAKKQVNASQASVNQALSNVQQAQAQVASNQVNLNQKQVIAPLDGIVGDFSVKVGDYVSAGGTLTTITKNDIQDMRISVPSNNAAQLRRGLPVELLDANTGKGLTTGSINFISPQVITAAQSILVKARFANSNGKLRDGQYVRARIIWSQQPGILIPIQVVTRIGGQSFVFVVEEDKSKQKPQFVVHQKPVKLGEVQSDHYPILEGIKPGDRLAVSNILKLRDGVPVQPQS